MPASPRVFAVFGHFHNLNLLALVEDLRAGRTARRAWRAESQLCPVAHGLPRGDQVLALTAFGPVSDLGADCDYAARHLGADPVAVLDFVRAWDEDELRPGALLRQLEALWAERLADAEAAQMVMDGGRGIDQRVTGSSSSPRRDGSWFGSASQSSA